MGLRGHDAAPLIEQVRLHLRRAAARGLPVTYRDLALALELPPPNTIHQVTELLEALMAEDAAAGRPFLAALVVSKARRGLPGPGFFECAHRLGRLRDATDPLDAAAYHARALAAAAKYWGGPGSDASGGR